MAYQYLTFAQLRTELLNRLEDYTGIYWVSAEANLYLQEALRTWQAMTRFWRDRMVFNTMAATAWYDLTAQNNTKIPYTLEDSDLLSVMLYHLIEPQLSGGSYLGSSMFTLADFTKAMERRRNQFLAETGMVTAWNAPVPGPTPPQSRLSLADSVIDIRRAAWIDQNGNYTTLWKSDEWAAESFARGWETRPLNPPQAYSSTATPPITLQLIPPPAGTGNVELITVSSGTALNPSSGVLLGVPDDFAWVVKWGALADLLGREGESKDLQRAEYCEARWNEGIALARMFSSVVVAYINGVETYPETVASLDAYRASWQNGSGKPDTLAMMSWNLMATSPVPDTGPYSIGLDVVRNCPVPVLDTDNVQLGREDLDAILDYAQHLAAFKQGGEEFQGSIQKYKNFVHLAQVRNERLKAAIPFYEPLQDRTTIQERESPRREEISA
jgi:hypothetical protein